MSKTLPKTVSGKLVGTAGLALIVAGGSACLLGAGNVGVPLLILGGVLGLMSTIARMP